MEEVAQHVLVLPQREVVPMAKKNKRVLQKKDRTAKMGRLQIFLRKHRSEVIGMSIFEYNKEEEERKLRKAEYEAGYDSGYDLGRKEGIEENMRKIVCAMLASGEMIEKIAQYTGYSVQEIEKFNVK